MNQLSYYVTKRLIVGSKDSSGTIIQTEVINEWEWINEWGSKWSRSQVTEGRLNAQWSEIKRTEWRGMTPVNAAGSLINKSEINLMNVNEIKWDWTSGKWTESATRRNMEWIDVTKWNNEWNSAAVTGRMQWAGRKAV